MRIESPLTLAKSIARLKANSIGRFDSQLPKSGTEMPRRTRPEDELDPSLHATRPSARRPRRVEALMMTPGRQRHRSLQYGFYAEASRLCPPRARFRTGTAASGTRARS